MPSLLDNKHSKKKFRPKSKDYIEPRAEVQNSGSSHVYVFGNDDIQLQDDHDDVEFELSEVRSRKAQREPDSPDENEPFYFDRQITEGDTLQSLSLQYGCRVSELKRINRLIKDQDFFGLNIIKVPLKKHSFLTELLSQSHESDLSRVGKETDLLLNSCKSIDPLPVSDHRLDLESACDFSDQETQNMVIRTLSINDAHHGQSREVMEFLANMDNDLSKIRSSASFKSLKRNSLDEVISVLTARSIQPIRQKQNWWNGADCGIIWTILIPIACLLVLIPVIYIIFFKV